MKKRLFALVLAAAMLLSLAACGSKTEAPKEEKPAEATQPAEASKPAEAEKPAETAQPELPTATEGKTLRVAIETEPGSFFPTGGTDAGGGAEIMQHMYDSLIAFGPNFELVPRLAKSWEQVDSLHYRFHLNENVKDSAGNDITASDVLFSFQVYAADPAFGMQVKYVDLENCVVEDDNTLLVAYNEENAFQFQNFAKSLIFDQQAYEADPDGFMKSPAGSGPYKLQEYIPGSKVTMVYNENYWGEKPAIETLVFYIIAEPSQRTSALENGEIDLDLNLASSDFDYVSGISGLSTFALQSNRSEGMWINCSENSILNDLSLRQAVCYAIDNAAIAKVVYKGMYQPSPGACCAAMTDYDPAYDCDYYAVQDMEKAKELVAASTAADKSIVIGCTGRADQTAAAEMIQAWLNEAGFTATIQSFEEAVEFDVLGNPAGGWDLGMTNFRCGSNYVLDMYSAYLGFLNFCSWSGENYDNFMALSAKGCSSTDEAVIKDCTAQMLDLIQQDHVLYNYAVTQKFIGKNASLNLTPENIYGDTFYAAVLDFE